MKKNYSLVIFAALCLGALWTTALSASEKTTDLPPPLSKAFAVYKTDGARQFINTLVKDGPMEGNIEIHSQVAILEKVETYYGKYQSYDVIDGKRFSDSIRLIYLLIYFEKGAVFGKLIVFKNKQTEIVSSFVFHTKPEQVFPEAFLISH